MPGPPDLRYGTPPPLRPRGDPPEPTNGRRRVVRPARALGALGRAPTRYLWRYLRPGLKRTKTRVRASPAMAPRLPDADRPSHATLTARPETSQVPIRSPPRQLRDMDLTLGWAAPTSVSFPRRRAVLCITAKLAAESESGHNPNPPFRPLCHLWPAAV